MSKLGKNLAKKPYSYRLRNEDIVIKTRNCKYFTILDIKFGKCRYELKREGKLAFLYKVDTSRGNTYLTPKISLNLHGNYIQISIFSNVLSTHKEELLSQ